MNLKDLSSRVKKFIRAEKWPTGALELPRLQAHRGLKKTQDGQAIKENSVRAFREAKLQGALMIECDVRLSKDQVPVIYHDADLNRLDQKDLLVSKLTANELNQLVGAPTLEQVLKDEQSPMLVNIEIKSVEVLGDPLERKIAEVVRKSDAGARVMISSFNPFSLFRVAGFLPEVPRALLVSTSEDPENSVILKEMYLAPLLSIHMLNLEQTMIDEMAVSLWSNQRIPISSWTVNDPELVQKHLKWGVRSVITDLSPRDA